MIVWDVALRCNIGTNHGKSMVWLCIQRRMADLGRILAEIGQCAHRASHLDRTALMWIEATPSDG